MIVFGKENPKGIFSFGVFLFAVPFGKLFLYVCMDWRLSRIFDSRGIFRIFPYLLYRSVMV